MEVRDSRRTKKKLFKKRHSNRIIKDLENENGVCSREEE